MSMKKILLIAFVALFGLHTSMAQKNMWKSSKNEDFKPTPYYESNLIPSNSKVFDLDFNAIETELKKSPDRFSAKNSSVIISFPLSDGTFEDFMMFEASNFEDELKSNFPQINSYAGKGMHDKSAIIRISVDPKGINAMIFRGNGTTEFIMPISVDAKKHAAYKSDRNRGSEKGKQPFTCSTPEEDNLMEDLHARFQNQTLASDGRLLTFRTAVSCTGEYAQYHGGTVAGALAAINVTMTRVNGLYERDLAIRMVLIANNNQVIFTNPNSDPYTTSYNSELQTTLTNTIGEANYDVGHLFVFGPDNGNAGCIGCVCDSGKGSAFTAADPPVGDKFDVDYVAHEFGHQFGGRHTFSHAREAGSVAQREVGGGTTIMGYAGITNQNVQMASDDYFHAGSIEQIQVNMLNKACPVSTPITHSAPVVTAGPNYTIPISTPFMLTGSATDAGGGALTYCWEQYDTMGNTQTAANSAASPTKATGPNWRSFSPSASPTRYFPTMSSIMNNSVTTAGVNVVAEALSSVARTLNFRLTVRDNVLNGGQTNFGNMTVNVDATRGPLLVTSQGTANISYAPGSTQTITWAVNNTNLIAGGNNVDILFTSDNGQTWTTLLANTPNDGSQAVTMPSTPAPFCRVMVKASNNIFFNVNTSDFSLGFTVTNTCNEYTFNTPFAIPDNTTTFTIRTINVPTTENISDVNLTVNLTHTWVSDLQIVLQGPMATTTQSVVFDRACTSNDNISATFDDQGSAIFCAPTITGSVIPATPLSIFNELNPNGNWVVGIRDLAAQDTGSVQSYTLRICSQQVVLNTPEFNQSSFLIYPNPNKGNFNIEFLSNSGSEIKVLVHDIRGRQIFEKNYSNSGLFNENINLSNVQSGIYMVTVLDGTQKQVKKVIVD